MKYLLLYILFTAYVVGGFSQTSSVAFSSRAKSVSKPPLDTSVFSDWPSVKNFAITNNGQYVQYTVLNHDTRPVSLMVQAINGSWKTTLRGMEHSFARQAVFTEDSRILICLKSKDSLCLLTLGGSPEYIAPVRSFRLFKQGNEEWLAYQLATRGKELVLQNIKTGDQRSYKNVNEYLISEDGSTLVLKAEATTDASGSQSLSLVNLSEGSHQVLWQGVDASNLVLDGAGTQLAFTTSSGTDKSIWHYKSGTDRAVLLVGNQSAGIENGLTIDRIVKFSEDGSRLFISVREKNLPQPRSDAVKVNLWSYTDALIQPRQFDNLKPERYLVVVHLNKSLVVRLQQENDEYPITFKIDDFVVVNNRKGDEKEAHWNLAAQSDYYLVSTKNGARTTLPGMFRELSPNGKYLIGEIRGDFYSYELASGTTLNITKPLSGLPSNTLLRDNGADRPGSKHSRGLGFIGWFSNGDAVFHDEFDLWQIDPACKKAPINLTGGYGRKNKIVFRITDLNRRQILPSGEKIIVTAFSRVNKFSGFFSVRPGKTGDPQLLSMGPYRYEPPLGVPSPIKARDSSIYVVIRQRTTESPNLFSTPDLRKFTPLSQVYPEKKYNWLVSELKSFQTVDGRMVHGVLYKPENFDPKKKYPVIIHYYEKKSQDLYKYHKPGGEGDGGDLDIAWFVSSGYLVFTPDIYYTIGQTGQSAYNSIVGAAKFLRTLPFVNPKKMGLQGHSLGGYETNYVVAHSDLFAAAISSSGFSDIISAYLSDNLLQPWFMEVSSLRIGTSLWERSDLYIKNSPAFDAHKVTTPILTVANKRDRNVPYEQGLQLFMALRRLGKKAWMLQYDEGGHGVGGKDYIDYLLRSTQFFDHYLKDAPAPKWMTRGIPAKMKGVDDGMELDDQIKTPGEGLLTDEEKKKVEILKARKSYSNPFQ